MADKNHNGRLKANSQMLVRYPAGNEREYRWILNVLIGELLGMVFEMEQNKANFCEFILEGRRLTLPNTFFSAARDTWLQKDSLPKLPLKMWNVVSSGLYAELIKKKIPVLYGEPDFTLSDFRNGHLALDVIGSAFFMLSRYEEVVLNKRDHHDRFSAKTSIAKQSGFLYRPIIDEYVEILWSAMKRIWPSLERKSRCGQIVITCDVDEPYERWITRPHLLLFGIAGAIIKRRSLRRAINRVRNAISSRNGDYRFDPNWNFDWYMDTCERAGHRVVFYFMSKPGKKLIDSIYELEEPRIQTLIAEIARREHQIGLHASYSSYRDSVKLSEERQRLIAACHQAGVNANINGNRQHFLRWCAKETPDHIDAAGFEYDSSGSFVDSPGFRFGTSKPFRMWSWLRHTALNLQQRPLVVMENSVISNLGMGCTQDSVELILDLRNKSIRYGGDFVLLWHNSKLCSKEEKNMFLRIIQSN